MRVAIIGAGAVGKWLAAIHLQALHEVVLICKNSQQAEVIENSGLLVNGLDTFAAYTRSKLQTKVWNLCDEQDFSTIDVVLATVKAHQWPAFFKEWEMAAGAFHREHTLWIAVHNGFVDYRKVAATISNQICRSVLTYGLTAIDQNCVEIRGVGNWTIEAPANDLLQNLYAAWMESLREFVNVSKTDDIEPLFWRKLILNASLNPVTALTGLVNGKVWDSPNARSIVLGLAQEAVEVCEKVVGIRIDDMNAYIEQVCSATYNNQSSMLQDVLAHKETEIDALNGVILQLSKRHNVNVKYQQTVYHLIKALE